MPKNLAMYILIGSLFVLGLSIGFFTSTLLTTPQSNLPQQQITSSPSPQNNLYSAQSATINGIILSSDEESLRVKNSDTSAEGEIKVSDQTVIVKQRSDGQVSSPSADLSTIELNKPVLIQLQMVGGAYYATIINYLSKPPSAPNPTTQTSQTPRN